MPSEETRAQIVWRDGNQTAKQAQNQIARGIDRLVFLGQDLDRRDHQECAKQIEHPMECVNGRGPRDDEGPAGNDCAQNAPEQHLVLHVWIDLEIRQDDHEDEHVVRRQSQLEQPALQEVQPRAHAKTFQDEKVESQAQRTPDRDPDGGVAHAHGACLAVKHAQVNCQSDGHHRGEQAPNQGCANRSHRVAASGTCTRTWMGPRADASPVAPLVTRVWGSMKV